MLKISWGMECNEQPSLMRASLGLKTVSGADLCGALKEVAAKMKFHRYLERGQEESNWEEGVVFYEA